MFGKLVLYAGMSAIVACPCMVLRWVSDVETADENDSAFLLKSIWISPVYQAVVVIVAAEAVDDLVAMRKSKIKCTSSPSNSLVILVFVEW